MVIGTFVLAIGVWIGFADPGLLALAIPFAALAFMTVRTLELIARLTTHGVSLRPANGEPLPRGMSGLRGRFRRDVMINRAVMSAALGTWLISLLAMMATGRFDSFVANIWTGFMLAASLVNGINEWVTRIAAHGFPVRDHGGVAHPWPGHSEASAAPTD